MTDKQQYTSGRGGVRKNAGRKKGKAIKPKTELKKQRSIRMTDDEYIKVIDYLKKLRAAAKAEQEIRDEIDRCKAEIAAGITRDFFKEFDLLIAEDSKSYRSNCIKISAANQETIKTQGILQEQYINEVDLYNKYLIVFDDEMAADAMPQWSEITENIRIGHLLRCASGTGKPTKPNVPSMDEINKSLEDFKK